MGRYLRRLCVNCGRRYRFKKATRWVEDFYFCEPRCERAYERKYQRKWRGCAVTIAESDKVRQFGRAVFEFLEGVFGITRALVTDYTTINDFDWDEAAQQKARALYGVELKGDEYLWEVLNLIQPQVLEAAPPVARPAQE